MKKWKCNCCGWIGNEKEMLKQKVEDGLIGNDDNSHLLELICPDCKENDVTDEVDLLVMIFGEIDSICLNECKKNECDRCGYNRIKRMIIELSGEDYALF